MCLNGQKTWITSAPVADFFTVFAKAGDAGKLSIFLVEKHFKGLVVGREIHKMGVWALPTSEVAFDDCFVPDSHRLSREEGDGEAHLRKTLAEIRIITGAMALGVARAALDAAVRYAAERRQFGKPINRFQAIQFKLAEMATDLEAAVHLVQYAAWLHGAGGPTTRRRRWPSSMPAKRRRASATRLRACSPATATRWTTRCSVTCATCVSH